MPIESSIPPEKSGDKPRTDYVDKTYQSWIDQGFEKDIPHQVEAPHTRLERFLTEAGDREIIPHRKLMRRIRYNAKEWLVIHSDLYSTTWTGEEIVHAEYIEGYHTEQTRKPVIDERKRIVRYQMGQPKDVYSIEFNKKNVDKYIGNQDKASIKYFIKHEGGPQNDYFTYDQFVNNTWDQNMELLLGDVSPQYAPLIKKDV